MQIKIKNILKKNVKIKLFNDEDYTLKIDEEIIINDYSDDKLNYIIKYLKKGLKVSKIINDSKDLKMQYIP